MTVKLYDRVKLVKDGRAGNVVEIDDDNGKRPPIYLVEIEDKPEDADLADVIIWCDADEIELIK